MAANLSRTTMDALEVLGLEIARQRRVRGWMVTELAERTGVTRDTIRKIERGASTVAVGTVFEVAVLVGVPLLGVEDSDYSTLVARSRDRLALLPARVRKPTTEPFDDF